MMKRLFLVLSALIAGALLLPSAAQAQVRRCLVVATSAAGVANYDPFNPSALSINAVQITFNRLNGPGGEKPAAIDFYIHSNNPATNGIQLIPTSVVGAGNASGLNQNIFYGTNVAPPVIPVPLGGSPVPGTMRYEFTGNNAASDVFVVTFNITLPPNLSLISSQSLNFDIEYGCNGTGGGPPFSERSAAPDAYTLQIHVRSGLQGSYIGPALNFGEVGDKTDAQAVLIDPTAGLSKIRVASTGPYTIEMTSQNGYRMTFPAGNPATENQNLRYQLTFLGNTRNPSNTAAITKTCMFAGIGAPPLTGGRDHPIGVQLLEGGLDGTPEMPGAYQDILTITLTPLAAGAPGQVSCP
jgi:spore coat protein U-like protein